MSFERRRFMELAGIGVVGLGLGSSGCDLKGPTVDLHGMSLLALSKELTSLYALMPDPAKTQSSHKERHEPKLLVRNARFDPMSGPRPDTSDKYFPGFSGWSLSGKHLDISAGEGARVEIAEPVRKRTPDRLKEQPRSPDDWLDTSWLPDLKDLGLGGPAASHMRPQTAVGGVLQARIRFSGISLVSAVPQLECLRHEIYRLASLPEQFYSDSCRLKLGPPLTQLSLRPLDTNTPEILKLTSDVGPGDIVVINFLAEEPEYPTCCDEGMPVHHFEALYFLLASVPSTRPVPVLQRCVVTGVPPRGRTLRCLKAFAAPFA